MAAARTPQLSSRQSGNAQLSSHSPFLFIQSTAPATTSRMELSSQSILCGSPSHTPPGYASQKSPTVLSPAKLATASSWALPHQPHFQEEGTIPLNPSPAQDNLRLHSFIHYHFLSDITGVANTSPNCSVVHRKHQKVRCGYTNERLSF